MRILITILFSFLLTGCEAQPIKNLGTRRNNTSILMAVSGESNAPGEALNSSATAEELAERRIRIWAVNTERFEKLDIGSNNAGSTASLHGVELEMANLYDSLDFGDRQGFLVKAGEGSTIVADWAYGTDLYERMIYRIDNALNKIFTHEAQYPDKFWLFWTQGINNIFIGTPSATWKTATKVIFDSLKSHYLLTYGLNLKIAITKFNQPSYTGYNTVIQEIDDEMDFVWAIDAQDAGHNGDNTHWSYVGFKTLGRRFRDLINAN